ncbi:MAG TPA: hypothetical protein VEW07_06955 [Solirubrobacterales bacterium]|nr:hypothetical protein [Solirubrobacterales bacterium]
MSPTVTAAQRDALYDQLLDRLSGIGDIEVAIQARDFEGAERIAREYSDDLRLLLDDLGIGDGDGGPVELTAPPELLRRALPRLRRTALGHTAALEREAAEVGDLKDRNSLIATACETVLGELDGTAGAR